MKNIFLIGMMGAGKSTIGKALSKSLSLPHIDIDNDIQNLMDMSIDKIFKEYGENRFRLIESAFFKESTKNDGFIFSTGGGIIEDKNNRLVLINKGISVFLDCSIETLEQRISNSTSARPMLNKSSHKSLRELYHNRLPLYKNCAQIIINTDGLTVSQTIKKILSDIN